MKSLTISLALLALLLTACGGGQLSTEAQQTTVAMAIQLTQLASDSGSTQAAAATETDTVTPTASPTETPIDTQEPTATSQPTATDEPTATPTDEPFEVPDWPLVRSGDQGPLVYAVQYLLRAHGYNLTVDGQFGPQTRNQVKAFQTAQSLSADGIVGENTWAALIQGNTVKQGSHGMAVRAVQYLLHYLHGYNNVDVDGDFGPTTDARTRKFQEKYDLSADGIVGPDTWQALIAIEP